MQSKHVRMHAYAEILTIRPLYLVELVTHTATTLKNHRPALCCAHNMTFRSVLCRACPSSGCRTNVSGYWQWCSLRAAATWSHPTVPTAGPCFYLKQQQQILTCTSFLFDSKNDKWNYFFFRKNLTRAQKTETLGNLYMDRICTGCCILLLRPNWQCWGCQHLKIICATFFSFTVLAAINGSLSNTSQSLSALLTGIKMVQNVCGKVCGAHGQLFSCLSFVIWLQYDTFCISHILFSCAVNLLNLLHWGLHDPLLWDVLMCWEVQEFTFNFYSSPSSLKKDFMEISNHHMIYWRQMIKGGAS